MELTPWIVSTLTLIVYTGVLFFYFIRRTRKHELDLENLLKSAKSRINEHKEVANANANVKVTKAFNLIRRLQDVTEDLEGNVQQEYDAIIQQAKENKKELISEAKVKAQEIVESADDELEEYRQQRIEEIEKDLVRLIVSVSEKVVGKSLDYNDHLDLIQEALEEVKKRKERI